MEDLTEKFSHLYNCERFLHYRYPGIDVPRYWYPDTCYNFVQDTIVHVAIVYNLTLIKITAVSYDS